MVENTAQKQYVNADTLAALFKVTGRRIYQLVADGVLRAEKVEGHAHKVYPFVESVQSYVTYLQDRLAKRGGVNEALNEAKLVEQDLRSRKLAAQVALVEGRAHSTEDVEAVMNDMLAAFRTRLRSVPLEVTPKLAGVSTEQDITRILADEIDNVCLLLSDYNADEFYARNKEYLDLDEEQEQETD